MRVFITGATGFLGSHTLDAFLDGTHDINHDVAVLVRPDTDTWRISGRISEPLAGRGATLTVISGQLDNPDSYSRALLAFRPDCIVNLAWSGVSNSTHNDPAQPENLAHVAALLERSKAAGARHWIGLGSQAEYGPRDHPINEAEPAAPVTAYGRAKLAACDLAAEFCAANGIRCAWLRLFSCYGPKDKESWLIPAIALKLLAGGVPALTEGRQRMDYLYAADAAAAVRAVAETPDASGIFNLASGDAVAVRDIARHIRDLIDPALDLGFGDLPQPGNANTLMQADISRLSAATGWAPETPLATGLATTIDWYRHQRTK